MQWYHWVLLTDSELVDYVKSRVPELVALYRFGSHVKGTARKESDVDLAVLVSSPIPAWDLFELAQELAARLHREVDLIDLRSVSTVMQMQVVSTGQCIFSANESRRREFEMYVYSDYARLNEERREILQAIATSGVIHGG